VAGRVIISQEEQNYHEPRSLRERDGRTELSLSCNADVTRDALVDQLLLERMALLVGRPSQPPNVQESHDYFFW